MKRATIHAIEYYLPAATLSNSELSVEFPDWPMDKIGEKTGIEIRHIAEQNQTASDLGVEAAKKLFAVGACQVSDIDYLIFVSQGPDYFLPTSACLVQTKLDLPVTTGAVDVNLGCSGFVYGLGLAKGLVETGQANNVLLITADTYSKFMHKNDRGTRSIFGDAATATLIKGDPSATGELMSAFTYGTDGRGAKNLIVATGGMRHPSRENQIAQDRQGNFQSPDHLYMNGQEIFAFTLNVVPGAVKEVLARAGMSMEDVSYVVMHQANKFMLENLRRKLGVDQERFHNSMRNCGNTVSSTIPIALKEAATSGNIKAGDTVLIMGFGVGYSWAGATLKWSPVFQNVATAG
jgi:3-oxoacyl-[acyl-carrier-protein] synthase-3